MKDKAKKFLKDWIIHFIKNRDMVFRKVISIDVNKKGFDIIVKYKGKEQFFLVEPVIQDIDNMIGKLDKDGNYALVVFNTAENFNMVVEKWDKLIEFKSLKMYFVNPFSNLDKKWIISPFTHHRICDESSLKTGLKSMFEMVEPLSEGQIEAKFK